jgi:hypothetical protein
VDEEDRVHCVESPLAEEGNGGKTEGKGEESKAGTVDVEKGGDEDTNECEDREDEDMRDEAVGGAAAATEEEASVAAGCTEEDEAIGGCDMRACATAETDDEDEEAAMAAM